MPLQKEWLVKFYSQDGSTLLKTVPWNTLRGFPTFSARINGGYGELVIDLVGEDYRFDDFDEGGMVDFLNIVKLYAVDEDNPLGRLIYTGFVSSYDPYLEVGGEGVRVTCLGLVSLLTASFYGTTTTYAVTQTGVDPEAIAQAIIDNFNAAFSGSLIGYSGTTETVGTNVTKTFTERKWFDALNDTKDLAGTGWWWMIREDGKLHFKAKPSTATHTFTFSKDIDSFSGLKTMEKVKNEIIVERTGGTRTSYTDATSQTTFGTGSPATGKWTEIIKDSGIANEATADQRGNKAMNDKKDQKIRAKAHINTNYDLESIKPGDTCSFTNYNIDNAFFGSNMLITAITYDGTTVALELEEETVGLGRELQSLIDG